MTNLNFKKWYLGVEPQEDEELLKALKRQISSYLKENTLSRMHGIFNKIFILRKTVPKEKFYDILSEGLSEEQKHKFIKFLLKEGFDIQERKENFEEVKSVWEHHLDLILKKYKNRKGQY